MVIIKGWRREFTKTDAKMVHLCLFLHAFDGEANGESEVEDKAVIYSLATLASSHSTHSLLTRISWCSNWRSRNRNLHHAERCECLSVHTCGKKRERAAQQMRKQTVKWDEAAKQWDTDVNWKGTGKLERGERGGRNSKQAERETENRQWGGREGEQYRPHMNYI